MYYNPSGRNTHYPRIYVQKTSRVLNDNDFKLIYIIFHFAIDDIFFIFKIESKQVNDKSPPEHFL